MNAAAKKQVKRFLQDSKGKFSDGTPDDVQIALKKYVGLSVYSPFKGDKLIIDVNNYQYTFLPKMDANITGVTER